MKTLPAVRLVLLSLPMILFATQSAKCEEPKPATDTDDQGFVAIFDGKTLAGWHARPKETAGDWSVRDGAIAGIGSANRQAYLVWKDDTLTDFELRFRYRMLTDGNTGVEVHARVDTTGKRPFESYHADLGHVGIGDNILGAWDFHFAKRREYPCRRGSSLVIGEDLEPKYSRIKDAVTLADIRKRDWNDCRVIADGNHYQFFINGKLSSEFVDNAKSGQLKQGFIGLQLHEKGMHVEFQNLRLKVAATEAR